MIGWRKKKKKSLRNLKNSVDIVTDISCDTIVQRDHGQWPGGRGQAKPLRERG